MLGSGSIPQAPGSHAIVRGRSQFSMGCYGVRWARCNKYTFTFQDFKLTMRTVNHNILLYWEDLPNCTYEYPHTHINFKLWKFFCSLPVLSEQISPAFQRWAVGSTRQGKFPPMLLLHLGSIGVMEWRLGWRKVHGTPAATSSLCFSTGKSCLHQARSGEPKKSYCCKFPQEEISLTLERAGEARL